MHKKLTIIVMLFLFLGMFQIQPGVFAEFDVSAGSAILMEASTGQILFEKNADVALPPASITKLMTLLIAFEALEEGKVDWDDPVTISKKAWEMGGSQMFLLVDTEVPFGEIITGISVVSANDGCVAVAEHLYGSEEAFVEVMNKRAKELGLTKTKYKNASGLHVEGHRMSAKDIVVLSRYIIENFPKILELESMPEYTYNDIQQKNRNPLIGTFPGADGLKTGWTNEAGYCLVGTALKDDMRLLSVVLKTDSEEERLKASSELLNYGFMNFTLSKIVSKGDIVGEVPVKNGKKFNLPLKATKDVTIVVEEEKKDEIKKVVVNVQTLEAPVSNDTPSGVLQLKLDGEVLSTVKLATAEETKRVNFFVRIWRAIIAFITGK